MNETPQVGDIWEEMDPRTEYHRFVKVTQVGKAGVFIHKVEQVDGAWITPGRAPNTRGAAEAFPRAQRRLSAVPERGQLLERGLS